MERNKQQAGFTLIEVLFSLAITLLLVVGTVFILQTINATQQLVSHNSNISLGMKTISQDLYTAREIELEADRIAYTNDQDERSTIYLDPQERLVRTPGYTIYAHGIENVTFRKQDAFIYITIISDGKEIEYWIGTDYQQEVLDEKEQ